MIRLFGVTLPDEKKIDYALTLIYGIGWSNVYQILKQANIDSTKKVKDLKEEDLKRITEVIEKNWKVEGDLREIINENIKRLKEIGSFRGIRHAKGLPVHGQRTKSNARTKKGKRKTVGALRKEAWAKLEANKAQTAKTTSSQSK
ncbi:MAG: 30S ribosomal protein S13 [Candidatus Microgenomates bacterium]